MKNDNFSFDDSGAKAFDLRLNLIEKRYRSMKEPPNAFSEFFLAIMLLEIIALVLEKIVTFSKFDLC